VADALSGAGGVQVATSDLIGATGGAKGGGAGSISDVGVSTGGGGDVRLKDKGDANIRGVLKDSAPIVDDPNVNADALAKYVTQRKSAIQNCYERELKRNPSLKGRLVVRFTIGTSGRTTEIEFEQNDLNDSVASCVRAVIRGWLFPFRPDEDVTVAYPFVFAPASG
jgi:hypothetical protein